MNDALGSPQSVLLLGGSSEIGLAITRKLVERRAKTVVLAGRDPESLKPAADDLRTAGASTVDVVAFDALATESHDAFVDDVFNRHGDFDLVVLAFGLLGDQEEAERNTEAALAVLRTNFVGAASVALPISRRLKAQGHGTLLVLSSVAAERARRANFVYGSSKAGLDAFCQGLGDSLVGTGARVVVVRPGFVHTKMTAGRKPAPLSTTPDAVADAVAGGLEKGAETIWAPPALRFVFSAMRHLPRPLWRRIKE
ncbi:MAG TPA: decaprenylphospho-beta-D-erythro-pentofuranosid-2-ulose 2-reductase [Acidimicrobiia bacterium]|nr:decaprenylphospho-beta-D-erythro-pentofuranosid-2-ulose 2-reductase [Acidimicrobiia bacterium]